MWWTTDMLWAGRECGGGGGVHDSASTGKRERGEPSVVVHDCKPKLQRPIRMIPTPRSTWTDQFEATLKYTLRAYLKIQKRTLVKQSKMGRNWGGRILQTILFCHNVCQKNKTAVTHSQPWSMDSMPPDAKLSPFPVHSQPLLQHHTSLFPYKDSKQLVSIAKLTIPINQCVTCPPTQPLPLNT